MSLHIPMYSKEIAFIAQVNYVSPMPHWIRETIIIGLATLGIAIISQFVLPNRIGWATETVAIPTDDGQRIVPAVVAGSLSDGGSLAEGAVTSSQAFELFQSRAIFLDAREPDLYYSGHIAGAINLPYYAFMDSMDLLDSFDPNTVIVTYCDGEDCNASLELASSLELMGFTQVKTYFGGWLAWQAAGYPIESTLP